MTSITLRKELVDNVEMYLTENGLTWDEFIEKSIDPFYSTKNQNWLKQSIAELEAGNVVVKTMEELEAMAE